MGEKLQDRTITYKKAISEALFMAMERNDDVILMGEDIVGGMGDNPALIDAWGGAFNVTKGFMARFGKDRVLDTPISESAFLGAAAGAAMVGLRPVVEIMYGDFMGVAFDQVLNQIPKQHYMFGGQVKMPITVRTTYGCGWQQAAHHSQVNYSFLVHIPGWFVLAPSTPHDIKGGLLSAIASDNPVFVFEHRLLYDKKGHTPEEYYELPVGKGAVRRLGTDLTIVAIGNLAREAVLLAESLQNEGISVEVVDPIWLKPLDKEVIVSSAEKTGRVLVLDEDNCRCSTGADIAAVIACEANRSLISSVQMLTCPDVPVPYSPVLEKEYTVNVDKIRKAVSKITSDYC